MSDINIAVSPGTPAGGVFVAAGDVPCDGLVALDGDVAVDGDAAVEGDVAVDGAVDAEGAAEGDGDTPKIVGDGAVLGDVDGAEEGDWLTLTEGETLGDGVGVGVPPGN